MINNLHLICPKLMEEFDDELPQDIFDIIIDHLENLKPEDCFKILQNVRNKKLIKLFFKKCEETKIINVRWFFFN